jgi:hypothetical protein
VHCRTHAKLLPATVLLPFDTVRFSVVNHQKAGERRKAAARQEDTEKKDDRRVNKQMSRSSRASFWTISGALSFGWIALHIR